MFDKNGDGSISVSELKAVMESLGKIISLLSLSYLFCSGQVLKTKELKRMIAEVDANRNGKIDLEGILLDYIIHSMS